MDFRRRTIKACYERTDWAELTNNSYPVIGDKKNGKTCETIGWSHIPFAINTLFSWHYFHRKTQTHGKECVIIEEMTWNRVCLKMTKDLTKDTRKEMTFLWQDIRERKKYNRKQGDRKTISWDAEKTQKRRRWWHSRLRRWVFSWHSFLSVMMDSECILSINRIL